MSEIQLIFEKNLPGRRAWLLPVSDVPITSVINSIPEKQLRQTPPNFPELAEIDVVRHYTNLSNRNHGVDSGFYPLGSCTMKYNPKVNENLAALPNFTNIHPYYPEQLTQGSLQIMADLEESLAEITGMNAFTLQPAAGAHGELTAMFIIKAYHRSHSKSQRTKVLIPTSAHGTNPASAVMAGFETISVNCNQDGLVDLEHLKSLLNPEIAALMLTNPNTLGLFERDITEIANLVHQTGGLMYYDGANLNAVMGLTRPGDMGFDLIHLNLHKTFATPHGGGGPGAGPVGVKSFLSEFLPVPVITKENDRLWLDYNRPQTIGKVHGFYGNFIVLLKALIYIRALGPSGLTQVSCDAVLNANYLKELLKKYYPLAYDRPCMHEFVLSINNLKSTKIRALDIAKRLLDFGIHPPTIYFPLIVEEAMMIEPTETEGIQVLEQFVETMAQIHQESLISPDIVATAPHNTVVSRVDEALAARSPKLRWYPSNNSR